jgi:hypothetical protein
MTYSKLDSVQKGIKARGKGELLKHLTGGRLTQRQAIHAHCYECMGYYSDGKQDCLVPSCPMYEFMPYRGLDEKNIKEK